MAGSCCNVPDGKMLVYTLALNPGVKAATGMKPPVGPANLCAKKEASRHRVPVATSTPREAHAHGHIVRKAVDAIASAKLKARG
jgi:hypothetical protein